MAFYSRKAEGTKWLRKLMLVTIKDSLKAINHYIPLIFYGQPIYLYINT